MPFTNTPEPSFFTKDTRCARARTRTHTRGEKSGDRERGRVRERGERLMCWVLVPQLSAFWFTETWGCRTLSSRHAFCPDFPDTMHWDHSETVSPNNPFLLMLGTASLSQSRTPMYARVHPPPTHFNTRKRLSILSKPSACRILKD